MLSNLPVRYKIMIFSLFLAITATLIVGAVSMSLSAKAIKKETTERLQLLRDDRKQAIEQYFSQMMLSTEMIAKLPGTTRDFKTLTTIVNALEKEPVSDDAKNAAYQTMHDYMDKTFRPEYQKKSGKEPAIKNWLTKMDPLSLLLQQRYIANNPNPLGKKFELFQAVNTPKDESVNWENYDKVHKSLQQRFLPNVEAFGFYDIFLITAEGRIAYTYFKETDFGTSLESGPWANTNLARVWKEARDMNMPNWFADYANYPASYEDPASFLILPIKEGDTTLGHIAFQIDLNQISTIMKQTVGQGETGEVVLVGSDYLMRSDSRLKPATHSLAASWANPANGKFDNPPTRKLHETGASGVESMIDYRNEETLTAYTPIALWNIVWGLIAKEDLNELYQPVNELKQILSLLVIALILFVIIASVLFSSRLTRPIHNLMTIMNNARTTGNLTLRGTANTTDEIGEMTLAFNELMELQNNMVKDLDETLDAISKGNFNRVITAEYKGDLNHLKQRANDTVDTLRNTMGQIRQAVEALKHGSFNFHSNTSELTGDFKSIMISLGRAMQQVHHAFTLTNEVMTQLSLFNLDARLEMDAAGDIATLQNNINNTLISLKTGITAASKTISLLEKGNFSTPMSGDLSGEMTHLKTTLNAAIEKINLALGAITGRVRETSVNSQELTNITQYISKQMTLQSHTLQESSAAMEKLSLQAKETTFTATRASEQAQKASDQVNTGVDIMGQSMSAMNDIRRSSRRITEILGLIDSIAFQTNLLALNAAVEAARAGEHGRGFAVVASEVRALSQKTVQAASDIKELIENNNEHINKGADLIASAGETMHIINNQIGNFIALVDDIMNKNIEQSNAIEVSNQSIQQIDQLNKNNSQQIQQASKASLKMYHSAQYLNEMVEQFTLDTRAVSVANDLAIIATKRKDNKTKENKALIPSVTQTESQTESQTKPRQIAALPAPNASKKEKTEEWEEF
jgi:methyl-accepting chemotaxis protein